MAELNNYGGGKTGMSAYELYYDIETKAGNTPLSIQDWLTAQNGNVAYASRSLAMAANIPTSQNTLRWYDGGALLEAKREPSVITRPCITTNGGAVYWSPVGQIEAAHYGIVPGAVANGRIEYATLDAASRGQRLYFRGSATPYTVTDAHIAHCSCYGDGDTGVRSDGYGTTFVSSGAGTVRRYRDLGTGTATDDECRTMLIAGRSEISFTGIRFDNAAGWEHCVIFPATRKCFIAHVTTTGNTREGILWDQSWSDRNTTLMALHPTIEPGAGCNECGQFKCDLGGAIGFGITGSVLDPDDYTGEDWLWGWGGASDFFDIGSRVTGATFNAACDNAAGMIQGITLSGTAFRVGSRTHMLTVDRATRLTIENSYAEASSGVTSGVYFTSRTAANGTEKITYRNCDWIRNTVYMDGVDTGVGINNGGGGLAFLDISTSNGTHYQSGMIYGPDGFRPRVSRGASAGTSSSEFANVRGFRFRSNGPELWLRTLQDGITTPRQVRSVGNSQVREELRKDRWSLFVPGISRPGVDDSELPDDPETASDGLVATPNAIFPNTSLGMASGVNGKEWSEVWTPTLRSSTAINLNAPAITANSMTLPRGTTRAPFVTAVAGGFDPGVGAVIFAGGEGYQRVTGATEIPDLPGYLPFLRTTPHHYGALDDFDYDAKTGTDCTSAIRLALATGRRVFFPKHGTGDYRVTGELEMVHPGQIVEFECTGGYAYGEDIGENWQPNVRIVATGTGTPRIRTRRLWRGSAGDPQDAALSVVLNIQAEGVVTKNLAIHLWCDYSDASPSNLGDDWDVGVFHGTRVGVQHENPQVIGYFRHSGIYHDFSGATGLSRFPSLAGPAYSAGTVLNGADGLQLINPYIRGPRQGLAILGALPKAGQTGYSDPYYDEILGSTIADARGSFGSSDVVVIGSRIYGPDHHSDRRLKDPVLDGGAITQAGMLLEPDDAPCAVHISGLAGNASGAGWGMRFFGGRIATFEAFRVRLNYAARVSFSGVHIEGRSGGRMDTAGNVIDTNDYATKSYGDISATARTQRVSLLQSVRQTRAEAAPHFYGTYFTLVTDTGRHFLDADAYLEWSGEADYRVPSGFLHRFRAGTGSLATLGAASLELRGQYLLQGSGHMDLRAASGQNVILRNGSTSRVIVTPTETQLVSGGLRFGNGTSFPIILSGAGSPEGVVTAPGGSLYLRTDGGAGTTLYVKQTASGNTGWAAK